MTYAATRVVGCDVTVAAAVLSGVDVAAGAVVRTGTAVGSAVRTGAAVASVVPAGAVGSAVAVAGTSVDGADRPPTAAPSGVAVPAAGDAIPAHDVKISAAATRSTLTPHQRRGSVSAASQSSLGTGKRWRIGCNRVAVRSVVAVVCLGLLVAACSEVDRTPSPGPASSSPAASAAVWPLRGTPAPDAESVRRRPLVVKIAADPAARPQSGLADADLVLEIPVEGGLTRFAAVFQSKDPGKVGPVRSARQSDLNYLSSLHAIVAHVGASEQVTKLVRDAAKAGGFVDIDELEHPEVFERTTDRSAPYNAYTTGAKLRQAGGADKVNVASLRYGDARASSKDEAVFTVSLPDPVKYMYESSKSGYHRLYGDGAATTDGGNEVLPQNVVVIRTDVTEIPGTADAAGAPSVDYRSTGTGPVVVYRDGKRFEGTWSRQGEGMYTFKDASGAEIVLKPGLTWLHIVAMGAPL